MKGKIDPLQGVILKLRTRAFKQVTGSFSWSDKQGKVTPYFAEVKSMNFNHKNESYNELKIVIGFTDITYPDLPVLGKGRIVVVEFGYIDIVRTVNNMVIMNRELNLSSNGYTLTLTLVDKAFYQDETNPNFEGTSVLETLQVLTQKGNTFNIQMGGGGVIGSVPQIAWDPYNNTYISGTDFELDYLKNVHNIGTGSSTDGLLSFEGGGDRLQHTITTAPITTDAWGIDLDGDGEVSRHNAFPSNKFPKGAVPAEQGEQLTIKPSFRVACTNVPLMKFAEEGIFSFKNDMFRHKANWESPFDFSPTDWRARNAQPVEPEVYQDELTKQLIETTNAVVDYEKNEIKLNNGFNMTLGARDIYRHRTIKPDIKLLKRQGFKWSDLASGEYEQTIGYSEMETKTMPDGTILYPVTTHGTYSGTLGINIAIDYLTGGLAYDLGLTDVDKGFWDLSTVDRTEYKTGEELFVDLKQDPNFSNLFVQSLYDKINEKSKISTAAAEDGDSENSGRILAAKQSVIGAMLKLTFQQSDKPADVNTSAMSTLKSQVENYPGDVKVSIDGNTITLHNGEPTTQFVSRIFTLDPQDGEENSRIISVKASTDNITAKMKEFNLMKIDEDNKEISDIRARVNIIDKEAFESDSDNFIQSRAEDLKKIENDMFEQDTRAYAQWLTDRYNRNLKEGIDFTIVPGENFKIKVTKDEAQELLLTKGIDIVGALGTDGQLAIYNEELDSFELEISAQYFAKNESVNSMIEDKIKRQVAKVEKKRNKLTLVILGDPYLYPGQIIYLKHISKLYSGKWLIQSVKHSVDVNNGYTTTLECTLPAVSLNYSRYLANKKMQVDKTFDPTNQTLDKLTFIEGYIKDDPTLVDKAIINSDYSRMFDNSINLRGTGSLDYESYSTEEIITYNLQNRGSREGSFKTDLDSRIPAGVGVKITAKKR